jgi:uncharacterized PurR-regulated membrane protein YhhQ (DUF165 family)
MRSRSSAGLALLAAYIGSVVLANYLTAHYGLVPVGFGLMATAGTWAISGAIMTRDLLQDTLGRLVVLAAIVVGAALSWVVANPKLAVASGVTFLLAETAELLVYTPLRRRVKFGTSRWAGVVGVANATGIVLDTILFLELAGFGLAGRVLLGQFVGKAWVTIAVITVAWTVRKIATTPKGRSVLIPGVDSATRHTFSEPSADNS